MRRKSRGSDKKKVLLWIDEKRLLEELEEAQLTEHEQAVLGILLFQSHHKQFPSTFPKQDYCTQAEFGRIFGTDQGRISRLMAKGILSKFVPWRVNALLYLGYITGVAAGRTGADPSEFRIQAGIKKKIRSMNAY